jgi:hypothetical protein
MRRLPSGFFTNTSDKWQKGDGVIIIEVMYEESPLRHEGCEEDDYWEDQEMFMPEKLKTDCVDWVKLDIAEDFEKKEELEALGEEFQDIFGPIDREGMRVAEMEIKWKGSGEKESDLSLCDPLRYVSAEE